MEKLLEMILRVSNLRLSDDSAIFLVRRLVTEAVGSGTWALVDKAISSSTGISSIRLKSFNSKGFSRFVKVRLFNGEMKLKLLREMGDGS